MPNNIMVITVKSGVSADGFDVSILNPQGSTLFKESYSYGYNASYSRDHAEQAQRAHEQAVKNNWGYLNSHYGLKPYVSDIIMELCTKYGINTSDIEYKAGQNVFRGDLVDDKSVRAFIDKYISSLKEVSSMQSEGKYYSVDFRVYKGADGKIKDTGKGEVTMYPTEDFERNCEGSLLKDFIAYDPLLAKAIKEMGIRDCAYLGWEYPFGFVSPVKPIKHFPKSVVSYAKALSAFYLSYGLEEIGSCECCIKDMGGGKVLARFASTDGICIDFKLTQDEQYAEFEDICTGFNLKDLSDEANEEIKQVQKLLPLVINDSIDLIHGMIAPDVNVDWVNFCFTPRKELGKKWMLGITNVPERADGLYESSIKSGTMKKGTLALHYIFGV